MIIAASEKGTAFKWAVPVFSNYLIQFLSPGGRIYWTKGPDRGHSPKIYKRISVGSVREALEVLNGRWGPEVLVSDLGMPEQDGYDLIRELRSLDGSSQIPAIAITGYAGNEEGKLALDAGFQKYLTKPVDWKELIETIAIFAR